MKKIVLMLILVAGFSMSALAGLNLSCQVYNSVYKVKLLTTGDTGSVVNGSIQITASQPQSYEGDNRIRVVINVYDQRSKSLVTQHPMTIHMYQKTNKTESFEIKGLERGKFYLFEIDQEQTCPVY